MRLFPVLLTLALGVSVPAHAGGRQQAQEPPAKNPVAEFIAEERQSQRPGPTPQRAEVLPSVPDVSQLSSLDSETRDAVIASFRAYYRYRQSGYEHRRRVFEWQLLSSKIIFWVVVLMVSAGICFSGMQFRVALWAARGPSSAKVARDGAAGDAAVAAAPVESQQAALNPSMLQTSLEASTSGIKVSSPVLGVIVLVISFLFFYMYLVHVYPITEIM